jgi:hypothetical protein
MVFCLNIIPMRRGEMQKVGPGALSGCIVWFILISVLSACLLPIAFMAGGFSSASEPAIQFTGKYICPEKTTPVSYSYDTTMTDENGFSHPATAYELHCVDETGKVVKTDPLLYSFLWMGIFAIVALLLSVLLSFIFAAPAGILIGRLFNRQKTPTGPRIQI